MGLFSFLKSNKPAYTDKVWRTAGQALVNMITDAMLAITRKQVPIVLCYFEDEFEQITKFLSEKGVPAIPLKLYHTEKQPGVVWYASATTAPEFVAALAKESVSILFFGHYPMPAKENDLLQKLQAGFPSASIVFYSSLDEPAFKRFGSECIVSLLDKLGMKEDEAIEHSMVSSAMQRAREKVASMVRHEQPATSEAEWFSRNVKDS
ncbi:MAG: hypothetical protein DYG99_06355 [Bacteroidetes bacterium CHB5]|nr:hypothetical protein [Bacteroidetes bacterium CHB5]